MNHIVTDNRAASRFEMPADGQLCVIDYQRQQQAGQSMVDLLHAEVPLPLRGRGLGEHLVKGTLDLVRQQGETVIPSCSFVALYIRHHREYQDLLA